MTGLIERLLTKRFGQPISTPGPQFVERRWNTGNENMLCVLFNDFDWNKSRRKRLGELEPLYGSARGGILLGGCLKLSMIDGSKVFGLYRIQDLRNVASLSQAQLQDPGVSFFMDSANVWYYGVKQEDLYVYDAETGELDCLGSIESEFENLLTEWEEAKA